jgi:dipeptidyl aminopeptidase/acylaminoacyl peptidase
MELMKQIAWLGVLSILTANAWSIDRLELEDIFNLEYASNVDISNDGKTVYFVRQFMDIHSDKQLGNIWTVDTISKQLTPVTTGNYKHSSPTLSQDGTRLAYISDESGKPQIVIKWLDSGATSKITNLSKSPSALSWSPNGKYLAFNMFVLSQQKSPVTLPTKPIDATWAKPAILIEDVLYRWDGRGYLEPGFNHVFIIPAEGGTPRQITRGDFNHDEKVSWSIDNKSLYLSANRKENFEFDPLDAEIFRVDIDSRSITALTDRNGPDKSPQVSPDGERIAFLGFDDKLMNYENVRLYVMDTDGTNITSLSDSLDRSISHIKWAANSKAVYIQYNDRGKTNVALQSLKGKRKVISSRLGGNNLGRPYSGGNFDVSKNGTVAFTYSDTQNPADVAITRNANTSVLTQLNEDALAHKTLGNVEEIIYPSSAGGLEIQGWIVYPPEFDKTKKYPLLLEIHGGPVAAYGPYFSAELQLYAAAGYVVLYTNPRGSESYGKNFAQTIHHNYPSLDFDDLMSGVDAMIQKGFIDKKKLFVSGGSGGGVLTSWIVGHTHRFAAAVVVKPVINWYSFALTVDSYPFIHKYWFAAKPWEAPEKYMKHSPISYVGNVSTPTMLLTGEADHRTPISESEQYYQALKLQGVETALVRIPDASHRIGKRPSHLMTKVAYNLWWFDKHAVKAGEHLEDYNH